MEEQRRSVDVWVRKGQKLASRAKVWSVLSMPTPDIEYSLMHFLKKLVFPWRLMVSIH
jgi:hypothetical protein